MSSTTHDIDPKGDLVVVLKDPNTCWVVPEVSLIERPKGSKESLAVPDTTDVDSPKMPSGLGDSKIAPVEIRSRVSSRHLALASDMFDKMLNGPWKESNPANSQSTYMDKATMAPEDVEAQDSKDTGVPSSPADLSPSSSPAVDVPPIREVTAEGWNAHALLTVFRIIHGQSSGIDRNVSLAFIAQVAIIVNYYQCAESVSLAAELLYLSKYKAPAQYGKQTIMWLFIAWVFSWNNVFEQMARQVVQHGQGLSHVTTHDLDIDGILDQIESKRKAAIELLHEKLVAIYKNLSERRMGCNHKCTSMMLGSLMGEKFANPDLPLDEKDDCSSLAVSGFMTMVNNFRPINWSDPMYTGRIHRCSPKESMQTAINEAQQGTEKLRLSDFQHNKNGCSTKGA